MEELHKLQTLAKDMTILYVEDEHQLRDETTAFLKKFFTIVDSAKNGKDGLELYIQNQYDIIITDIKMPIMNGIEMIKEIRKINSKQLVIIISAFDFSDLLSSFLKEGVNKFLSKPVTSKNLIIELEGLCEIYHSKDLIMDDKEEIKILKERVSMLEKKLDNLIEYISKK